jgi:hypothetical protein
LPMALTVTIHHDPGCLRLEASGPATLADHCGFADLIATVCAGSGYRRALANLLALQPQMSFTDHLQLGAYVAGKFKGLDKVATVVSLAARTGSSEKAAQKLGAHLRTFTDLEEARAWLAG